MTVCVIKMRAPGLEEIAATLGDGKRQAISDRRTEALGAWRECRYRTPLRVVFRSHFILAQELRFAELPFHNTCPSTFQSTRCGTRVDVAELLENGLSILIEPVEREFKPLQRQSRSDIHRDEAAGIVVDMAAFISVRDDCVGREDCGDLTQGNSCVRNFFKQVLVAEVGTVGPRKPLARGVGNVTERAGTLLKTLLAISFQASERALEAISDRSSVGGEHDHGRRKSLEQPTTRKRLIIGMGDQNQWTTRQFDGH